MLTYNANNIHNSDANDNVNDQHTNTTDHTKHISEKHNPTDIQLDRQALLRARRPCEEAQPDFFKAGASGNATGTIIDSYD